MNEELQASLETPKANLRLERERLKSMGQKMFKSPNLVIEVKGKKEEE